MKIELSIEKMVKDNLVPNQIILLLLLYHKDFKTCKDLFGLEVCYELRNSLVDTNFILCSRETKFTETIISKNNVEKLLGLRSDGINFWEFYNCYPIKIGNRVLRSSGPTSQIAKKHEEKYLKKIKTKDQHEIAIKAVTAFVSSQKSSKDGLKFLPNMETVMNNSMWEQWEVFIEQIGKEGQEWNNDTI